MAPKKAVRVPGRAVGYIRVSTVDQAREGYSLDAQRKKIEAYCLARGWDLVFVYADEGISAVKARPEYERMVADVLADGISHVVTIKIDRLGRTAVALLNLFDVLESKGVGLVFIDQGIDTSTPAGKLMRTMLVAFAEFERDMISERTRAGMAEAKAQGVHVGRTSTLDPAVRERIEQSYASGVSMNAIAGQLNDEHVPTATGSGRWYASTIKDVLRQANL